jgi:hypothetical protein
VNRARVIATAAAGVAAVVLTAGPAAASPVSAGAGTGAEPACSSAPLSAGGSVQLRSGGAASTPGVMVVNTGSSAENLTLTAGPLLPGSPLAGRSLPAPAGWFHVSYPRSWLVLRGHSVHVPAGGTVFVPVSVTAPASARPGFYAGSLTVSAGTGSGGVQLGAAAETLALFTVGIPRPVLPPAVMGVTGSCWTPPGTRIPWAQWTRGVGP